MIVASIIMKCKLLCRPCSIPGAGIVRAGGLLLTDVIPCRPWVEIYGLSYVYVVQVVHQRVLRRHISGDPFEARSIHFHHQVPSEAEVNDSSQCLDIMYGCQGTFYHLFATLME